MKEISLCNLCVLCVSVVNIFLAIINHRDTENTEVAQRSSSNYVIIQLFLSGIPYIE